MEQTTFANDIDLATQKKEMERELIKSLAGMYRVTFKFAETFSPIKDYFYHDRHFSGALEYVHLLEETENKISLQHILYVGEGKVIKHWRQDWIYENQDFLVYHKDHEWHKKRLDAATVKGTWTQKVYQVDDCPRYEGYGTWVHVDGRHFWKSTTDAPLPRREYSIGRGEDYNVLKRGSHIEIFPDGSWILEQDNEKIYRNDKGEDTLICMEKGLENLTVGDYDQTVAAEWWAQNKAFWADVRTAWNEHILQNEKIKVHVVRDGIPLYEKLFDLNAQFAQLPNYDSAEGKAAIQQTFATYVDNYQF